MFESAELCSVCKDKTYEYLSRAICHMTPDSSLCSSFCGLPCSPNTSASRFVYFFYPVPLCFIFLFNPQEGEGLAAAVPSVLQFGLQPHLRQPGLYEVAS